MSVYDNIGAISSNPLGTMGLGMYDMYNPMMAGMYGLNPMGMMGMYNPAFMQQMAESQRMMAQMQQGMELSQVEHGQKMHEALVQAEVSNLSAHDRATFNKITTDGEVQRGIRKLADVIRKGDADAVGIEYDKLKSSIYTKFADDLTGGSAGNNQLNVDRYIEIMYAQITQAQSGVATDLRDDIKKYCESAFEHGFNTNFLGNSGHNRMNAEEVIAYIDGTRINDKGSKERADVWGKRASSAVEFAGAAAVGYVGGTTLLGIRKFLNPSNVKFFENFHKYGKWGLALLAIADIGYQFFRKKDNNATT